MSNTHIALRSENPSEVEVIACGSEEFVRGQIEIELARKPLKAGAEEIELVRIEEVWMHLDRDSNPHRRWVQKYPSGIDWQQRISSALGCRPGSLTYSIEECVEAIEGLRESRI